MKIQNCSKKPQAIYVNLYRIPNTSQHSKTPDNKILSISKKTHGNLSYITYYSSSFHNKGTMSYNKGCYDTISADI